MTGLTQAAITAATTPILTRLPSLGEDAATVLAAEVLHAAQPHLGRRESQEELFRQVRVQMARAGLTFKQQGQLEAACARLIEASARPDYRRWAVPKPRAPRESAG